MTPPSTNPPRGAPNRRRGFARPGDQCAHRGAPPHRRPRPRILVASVIVVAASAACTSEPAVERHAAITSPERWNATNDPAAIDRGLVYALERLPTRGALSRAPIPGDYWPTYEDSINRRWDGEGSLSPAEKWGLAFGRPETAKAVSRLYGLGSSAERASCATTPECARGADGSECAKLPSEATGRCIPTWHGICDGWAAFAISEPPARRPVTRNGVTFYAGDLEALMSLVYSAPLPTHFLSSRCDEPSPEFDRDGRVTSGACRDVNAGAFHVVATNLIGLRDKGFVFDISYDNEVWNQPARSFEITNLAGGGAIPEISRRDAAALAGGDLELREVLATRELAAGGEAAATYRAAASGDVIVRTAGRGAVDLYVKRGARATESESDCRALGSAARKRCRIGARAGDLLHVLVKARRDRARVAIFAGVPRAGELDYPFHPEAARFFSVAMSVAYVRETVAARFSRVARADDFTERRVYRYVVETDASGQIIGGEWAAESQGDHPDFVWWPAGPPARAAADGLITYAEVKELNDEAAFVLTDAGAPDGASRDETDDARPPGPAASAGEASGGIAPTPWPGLGGTDDIDDARAFASSDAGATPIGPSASAEAGQAGAAQAGCAVTSGRSRGGPGMRGATALSAVLALCLRARARGRRSPRRAVQAIGIVVQARMTS